MKDQIFISYRRDGGEALAQLLHDRLTDKGYKVFYDIESLKSGPFDTKLYQKIEECEDFILVLPPQALDRCIYDEDWVRCEIKHALKMQKNIIPILMRGFVFPQILPDDIQAVSKMNGVEFETMGYMDAKIDKIISMLNSSATSTKSETADDQLNDKFNELFGQMDSKPQEEKSVLRKKMEEHQFVNHVLSFVPKSHLGESAKSFYITINQGCFEISAPSNFQFSAIAIYYDYYDYETLTFFPKLSAYRFEKSTENSNVTKTIFNLSELREQSGSMALVSIDTNTNLGYVHYATNISFNKILSRAVFSGDPMRIEYTPKKGKSQSDSCYATDTEEHTMLYDANDDSKAVILDLETGEFVLRHAVYDKDGKKEYKLSMVPFKKYLALDFRLTIDGKTAGQIRKMRNDEIADCYFKGSDGFPQDILKAVEYYEKDGSEESLFKIATLFLENDEYKDEDTGIEYMIQAAKKNYLEAIKYLSNYYYQCRKYDEAIPYDMQIVDKAKEKASKSQLDSDMDNWAVDSLNFAITLIYAKKHEDAETNLLNALHIYKKLDKPSNHRKVGNVYYWLSELYFEQGEYVRPEKYLLKALEFYKGCDDKDDEFLNRLGLCYNNLAYAYKNMGQYSEAETAYIEAYQLRKDLASRNSEQYNAKLKIACEKLISFYELTAQPELKNKYVEELSLLG